MAFTPSGKCFDAANAAAAAGGKLTKQDVIDAFERVQNFKDKLTAAGQPTGGSAALKRFGAQEAEKTRIAAAIQRRNAGLNALIRDKIDAQLEGFWKAGIRPQKALLAILEGTNLSVENGRATVAAQRQAFNARYLGALASELERDAPHIMHLLNDPKLDADTLREMLELRNGGKPGITGNKDAVYLAKTIGKYSELSRIDANARGANIGKLDGWAGVQVHDDLKMIAGGAGAKERWIGYIVPKLDIEKTFPDGLSPDEVHDTLGKIYDTIITGFSEKPGATELGKFTAPAGLAKSMAANRVLHFKDADSALAYREAYGYSSTIGGMVAHLSNMARINANLDVLGPNPEVMFAAVAKSLTRKIKDATEVPAGTMYRSNGKDGHFLGVRYKPTLEQWKNREGGKLDTQAGVLRAGLDVATGASSRPVNVTAASIGRNVRAVTTMAKIGASLPSLITDVPISAGAAQFRGGSFLKGIIDQFTGVFGGHSGPVDRQIAYMFGVGFDGILGHIHNTAAGEDRLTGAVAKGMVAFLKISGHTWWTDASRATAGRLVAAEMGMHAPKEYGDLPKGYQRVLSNNGIDQARWDIIRQSQLTNADGRNYVTPDRIGALPDQTFAPLVQARLDAAAKSGRNVADKQAAIIASARSDVHLSLLRFVADEISNSVMTRDPRAQRWSSWGGNRPGTLAGEVARYVMQFKGFPMAFMSRSGGRALYGFNSADALHLNPLRPDTFNPASIAGEQGRHIGSLLAGLTVAGYMAMTAKDALKGYWPPRNPADPRTMIAAFQQSGGLGIYGDFLFGAQNRFGGTTADTLLGPNIGAAAQFLDEGMAARDYWMGGGKTPTGKDAKFPAATLFSTALGSVPFANLHFLKPAMDYLFINSLREMLSPGYLKRQATNREQEYGQTKLWPDTAVGR